jgi:hypothetical protein
MYPLYIFNTAATTASFSNGFKEQVEYDNFPPTFSNSRPLLRIANYSGCNDEPSLVDHFSHFLGIFLIAASDEHGTSHTILSNCILLSN